MRGGNRSRISTPGAKVPAPPPDLTEAEQRLWLELATAVERLGTFQPSDVLFFRLCVRTLAQAECAAEMAPTARARVLQAAGSMLNAFGLSPLSRERVEIPEDDRSPGDRLRDELAEATR